MPCSVCLSLQREGHLLSQIEAVITLQNRAEMFTPRSEEEHSTFVRYESREILVAVRKRQAGIATRLEMHKDSKHRVPA